MDISIFVEVKRMVKQTEASEAGKSLKGIEGIGKTYLERLVLKGYTLQKLSYEQPERIARILGCSVKKAKEIVNHARNKYFQEQGIPGPMTAKEYKERMKDIRWFSSGCKALDNLLHGGFRSKSTVGLSGPFATGKTQCVLTTIANCIHQGYDAILFETEMDTFDPNRVEEIALKRGWNFDYEKLIVVSSDSIRDTGTQFLQYQIVEDKVNEEERNVGVFAIDSFTATFIRRFQGREEFPSRKAELNRHLNWLEDFAKRHNTCILLTCQVIEVPVTPQESRGQVLDSALVHSMTGTRYLPWGGSALTHGLSTWISFSKTYSKDIFRAEVFDSSRVKRESCYFTLDERGFADLTEQQLKKVKGK